MYQAGEDISVGKTVVGDDLVLAGRNGDLQLIAVPFFIFQIQGLVSAVHKLAHRKVREVCPVLALSLLEDNGAAPLVQDLHRNEAAVLINLCQLVDGVHSGYDAQARQMATNRIFLERWFPFFTVKAPTGRVTI